MHRHPLNWGTLHVVPNLRFNMQMSNSESNPGPSRNKTNAARRLHVLLLDLRSREEATLFNILPAVLGVMRDEHDSYDGSRQAMRAFGFLDSMVVDVRREVLQANLEVDDPPFYLRCLPAIYKALSPATCTQAWKEVRKSAITDLDLSDLEHVDRILRRSVSEEQLETTEFGPLLSSIDQALAALKESPLPEPSKDFLLSRLLEIKNAVEQYKFRGMRGIQEAAAAYCGSLAINETIVESKVSPENRAKLFEVLSRTNVLVSIARTAYGVWPHVAPLVQDVGRLFLT